MLPILSIAVTTICCKDLLFQHYVSILLTNYNYISTFSIKVLKDPNTLIEQSNSQLITRISFLTMALRVTLRRLKQESCQHTVLV